MSNEEATARPVIHPTAIVDPAAKLAPGVVIGPYCIVGADVSLGERTELLNNTTVVGRTRIGRENRIGPYSSIGLPAQHLHDAGAGDCRIEIGDRNHIREFTTIHMPTQLGGCLTSVGDGNFLMSYVHIAHDCHVGNNVIFANSVNLGGHTTVRDRANIGGMVAVHQFVTIGEYVMIGGLSAIRHDVPPYVLAEGNPARLRGLNRIGMKRNGFDAGTLAILKKAYRIMFRSQLTVEKATKALTEEFEGVEVVSNLVSFVSSSKRGVCR